MPCVPSCRAFRAVVRRAGEPFPSNSACPLSGPEPLVPVDGRWWLKGMTRNDGIAGTVLGAATVAMGLIAGSFYVFACAVMPGWVWAATAAYGLAWSSRGLVGYGRGRRRSASSSPSGV